MFKNYFKVAIRNLFRQKAYSVMNLLGLALGISCGLLLTLHIKEELSYEKSYPAHNRIYRMVSTEWSKSNPPLAAEMVKFFPEIKSTARFAGGYPSIVNTDDGNKTEVMGYFADSTAPAMFNMKSVLGDPFRALSEPMSMVITRSLSEKLFGKKDPVGQRLVFNDRDTMWVKGVIENMPENSHLKFDYLTSMPTFYKYVSRRQTSSRNWMFGWTYVEFHNADDVKKAQKRFTDFWLKYHADRDNKQEVIADAKNQRFQPVTDIHLKSDLIQEMGPNSNIIYIYIFIAVQALILLIACVNFINLFTTQALKRLKEVAVRKVLGAQKIQLVLQFLGEAFILTILAGIIAIGVYEIAIPFYNGLTGKHISGTEILRPGNLLIIAGIIFSTGLLSGLFPALFISRFQPAQSLKTAKIPRSSANILRKGLVVFQFVVASFLIISTVLVYQQMKLFRDKKLGFDKDQVMVVKLYGNFANYLLKHQEVIKNEIMSNPDIISAGRSGNTIGDDLSVEYLEPVPATQGREYQQCRVFRIDEHYLDVMNIKLKEGRNFSTAFKDSASFIINQKAVDMMGLKHPVGAEINNFTMNLQGKVVGVVENFHFATLHNQVEPLVLEYKPQWAGNLLVKIRAGKTASAINFLKAEVEKIAPGTLFSYGFLDEKIAGLYKKEDSMSNILSAFSVLAIIISCLGLFGLVAFASEMRTKEIGIRKVIGASVANLIRLLSKDFIILVLIGNIIAWPLAWYAMNKWLQEFTYKVNISWQVFFMSTIITIFIAMITIAYHCLKTAGANPVKSLRTE